MTWSALGALLAGLAVVTGAFAAHGLDGMLQRKYEGQTRTVLGRDIPAAEKYLGDFKTAAHYQMVAHDLTGSERCGRSSSSTKRCNSRANLLVLHST